MKQNSVINENLILYLDGWGVEERRVDGGTVT